MLHFRLGLVVGRGRDPFGTFTVFGIFGQWSGRTALQLTYAARRLVSLDGVASASAIHGQVYDEARATGRFSLRPLHDAEEDRLSRRPVGTPRPGAPRPGVAR